ncbi:MULTISPECIES: C40 family peptidase [Streptomycetaceae]|uniref:C40 family peptidase n=1 Tax=Streptomycetaceae TaxID=2062 RepID=UPI00059F1525|nr:MULTISPECIES: C40 family peptidase [Streptomycetaceae]MYS60384.1 glycoside hydrolase [Streptomyces sp. SID5468]
MPPSWVRRAGVAGGVIGAVALTGAASPAQAAGARDNGTNEVTQTLDLSELRAADATAQAVVTYQLQAEHDQAATEAERTAEQRKASDEAARAAAAKAAEAKQAAARAESQAASRSAERTSLGLASTDAPAPSAGGSVASVISFLQAQLGKAYVMGATGPTAYDCSGLVQAAFRTIGVDLPRVSEDQSTAGTQVSLDALQPGDILYWGGAGSAYHVAVYVGGGNFIGAQNPSSGVVERPLSYSQPTGAVRVA